MSEDARRQLGGRGLPRRRAVLECNEKKAFAAAQGRDQTMAFNLSSWLHRKRVQAEVRLSGRPVLAHHVTNPYHAVSIKAGASCGQTALRYGGHRHLSREAPVIPLPTCDTKNCRCRYLHHEDRRDDFDRRQRDVGNPNANLAKSGDRRSHGRRVTDN